MSRTIAVVEDDPDQRAHYAQALRGHDYRVLEFGDRASAMQAFERQLPDLAILDIMLGDEVGGGFELSRWLSARDRGLPVLFLTSRGDELDRIYGLQTGAWDYQTKPVSLDFLLARVESLFRICDHGRGEHDAGEALRKGRLRIDRQTLQASWDHRPLGLTPTEFELLATLVQQPDGVSYDGLASATRQGLVENNTINTHMVHLRRKFRAVDPDFDCIRTRYGFGYAWVCR